MQARVKVLRSCERDPAGCVRHRLDDAPSATDDDWNAGDESKAADTKPNAKVAPAEQARSEEQILENEESYVLNQVTDLGVLLGSRMKLYFIPTS